MGNSLKGEYMPKIRNIRKILGMGVLCLFLLGCSKDSFLLPEEGQENLAVEEEQDTLASEVSQENHVAGEQQFRQRLQIPWMMLVNIYWEFTFVVQCISREFIF